MAIKRATSSDTEGSWTWRANKGRLTIKTRKRGALSDISGDWSLQGLSAMLDGLSRGRLARVLAKGDDAFTCPLGLSNGRRLTLVGGFTADGKAEGTLRLEAASASDFGVPGPDLEPAFQPIISIKDGSIAGFEALARWDDTPSGAAMAGRFEDDALAPNMLIKAAETLAFMRETTGRDDLFLHVNLTGRDLAREETASLVKELVLGHDLAPGTLRIELTEQAALRDTAGALKTALAIKAAGAGLVLDDFGSGHSSFAWLADLPADALKIDPDLTRRIGNPRTDTILEAVTLLASRLNMTVTAEGIEDKAMISKLRALGFDYVQGFAFGRPMARADAMVFLRG